VDKCDELSTQLNGIAVRTEASPAVANIRIVDNDLLNATARHEFGAATFRRFGTTVDSLIPNFMSAAHSLKELDGDPGRKLTVDGLGRLFVNDDDGASGQDLNIGAAFNNDKAIALRYSPGTVGAGAGQLIIGHHPTRPARDFALECEHAQSPLPASWLLPLGCAAEEAGR
jgi:hypothetical protein